MFDFGVLIQCITEKVCESLKMTDVSVCSGVHLRVPSDRKKVILQVRSYSVSGPNRQVYVA